MAASFAFALSVLMICGGNLIAAAVAIASWTLWTAICKKVSGRSFYAVCGVAGGVFCALTQGGEATVLTLFAGVIIALKSHEGGLLTADVAAFLLMICAAIQAFFVAEIAVQTAFDPIRTAFAFFAPIPLSRSLCGKKRRVLGLLSALPVAAVFAFANPTITRYAVLFVCPMVISACLSAYKAI